MADALQKPVLFLAYANDRLDGDRYLRDVVREIHALRDMLRDKVGKSYEVVIRDNASLEDLFKVFDEYRDRIRLFHFAGHANNLQLLLDQSRDERSAAGLEGFTRELQALPNLQLVFLNACTTRSHALAMAEAGIPAVISTATNISDQAAYQFSIRFYEQLVSRKGIAASFEVAERRVQAALMSGGSFRSLYWEEDEVPDQFPWGMHGEGLDWRLATPRPLARVDLTPLMVNREKQAIDFRDTFERILANPLRPPHVFVIHGMRAERHESLVTRLVEKELRGLSDQLFGKTHGVVHQREVPKWPNEGTLLQRQRELKRRLAEAMDFRGRGTVDTWTASDLVEALGLRPRTIVLQHRILGDLWDPETVALIRWYVSQFWQLPPIKEAPQFIIFINVIYGEDSPNLLQRFFGRATRRQRIQEELETLALEVETGLTVLRELHPVTYADVLNWVDEYYRDTLSQLPQILFDGNQDRKLTMDVVEPALFKAIQSLDGSFRAEGESLQV